MAGGRTAGRGRSSLRTVVGALIAVAVLLGIGLGVVLTDPTLGDQRAPATVEPEAMLRGTRMVPARLGADAIRWEAGEGEVTVVVRRVELATRGSSDLSAYSMAPQDCQQVLVVELSVSYDGAGTFTPATDLIVQRMRTPVDVADADSALATLAVPLLEPGLVLSDGARATGTVAFVDRSGTDVDGHLLLSTREGAPVFVGVGRPEHGKAC